MLSLYIDPKLGIILNGLQNVVGRCRFLQVNPCVSLIPDDPTDKHGEGGHRLPVYSVAL